VRMESRGPHGIRAIAGSAWNSCHRGGRMESVPSRGPHGIRAIAGSAWDSYDSLVRMESVRFRGRHGIAPAPRSPWNRAGPAGPRRPCRHPSPHVSPGNPSSW
jgi:hypothetical protein